MMRFEKLAELAGINIQKVEDRVDDAFAEQLHKFYKLVVADCINVVAFHTITNMPTPLNELYELDTEV